MNVVRNDKLMQREAVQLRTQLETQRDDLTFLRGAVPARALTSTGRRLMAAGRSLLALAAGLAAELAAGLAAGLAARSGCRQVWRRGWWRG